MKTFTWFQIECIQRTIYWSDPHLPWFLNHPILLLGDSQYCQFARFFVFGRTRLAVYSFKPWNHLAETLKTFLFSLRPVHHGAYLPPSGGLEPFASANPHSGEAPRLRISNITAKEVPCAKRLHRRLASHQSPRVCLRPPLPWQCAQPLRGSPGTRRKEPCPAPSFLIQEGENPDFKLSGFYHRSAHPGSLTGCSMTSPEERQADWEEIGLWNGEGCSQGVQTFCAY